MEISAKIFGISLMLQALFLEKNNYLKILVDNISWSCTFHDSSFSLLCQSHHLSHSKSSHLTVSGIGFVCINVTVHHVGAKACLLR